MMKKVINKLFTLLVFVLLPNMAYTLSTQEKLFQAARSGNTDAIEDLTSSNQFDMETLNEAVIKASSGDHLKAMKFLFDVGADVNRQFDDDSTFLIHASSRGEKEKVKMLLDAEADPDIQDIEGYSALIKASRFGHPEIVDMLIEADADLDLQTYEKTTALIAATDIGIAASEDIVNKHTHIVKSLTDAGANVNIKGYENTTALLNASDNIHVQMVKILIDAEADVNARDILGLTSLMKVSKKSRLYKEIAKGTQIVEMLLEAEADVNIRDVMGETVLMMTSGMGLTGIVELLANAGNVQDQKGTLALKRASQNGHKQIVDILNDKLQQEILNQT